MHAAPAVGVRCAGGAAWRALQALLPGLAAAACAGWLILLATDAGPAAAALAAGIAGAALALACWRRAAPVAVALRWDGSAWRVDDEAGLLDVMIDLGGWMLLRLRPARGGAARWVAVGAGEAGGAWPALRAAVHAGGAAALPGAAR